MRNGVVLLSAIVVCAAATAMSAQSDEPKFEVASVKPNTTGPETGRGYQSPEGRFLARNTPLKSLIALAYQIDEVKLVAPGWTEDTRFDIDATTPAGPRKPGEIAAMLRGLLAERFALRAHREMRETAVYKLTRLYTDRLGPNIRSVTVDCDTRTSGQLPPCRTVGLPNGMHWFARDWAQMGLAQFLSIPLQRTVVDATGLSGQFEVNVEWQRPSDGTPVAGAVLAAVEEQLGLRLTPEKLPLEHVVVDSIQRLSPN